MLYLLFDAQPPRMIPYTARLVAAKMNRIPMSTPGAIMNRKASGSSEVGPNGTTAKARNVVNNEMQGDSKYSTLSTCVGMTSSLNRNFRPSASGCSSPNLPTRLGPRRS